MVVLELSWWWWWSLKSFWWMYGCLQVYLGENVRFFIKVGNRWTDGWPAGQTELNTLDVGFSCDPRRHITPIGHKTYTILKP